VSDPSPGSDYSPRSDATVRSLVRTFGLLKRVMEPHFGQFGISGAQWAVLRALHRAQETGEPSLRLTDLGDRLLVRPPSVSGVVDRLHRLALVRRQTSPDDARAKQVSLTPAGRHLVERVLRAMPQRVESILSDLSPTDRGELRRLLETVSSRLEVLCGAERPG
jgi:DNA-binding MarR family transcriptional regulator